MRVLAINDISCVGKCSLSVTLPIVSACGVTCDVLPTALLSTHTGGFEGYAFYDLTSHIAEIIKHWKTLGIRYDVIYSGYLGSIRQIELVSEIKKEFLSDNGKFVVDPVMGDNGKLYAGFTPEYVERMKKLCAEADYILPNLTEACYLTNTPYPKQGEIISISPLMATLEQLCPFPVITGVSQENGIAVCYKENKKTQTYTHENVEGFFCGAGDVFASAFVGVLAKGKKETEAVKLASDFVTDCIRRSSKEVADKRYGLNFEAEIFSFLKKLNG